MLEEGCVPPPVDIEAPASCAQMTVAALARRWRERSRARLEAFA